MKHIRVVAGMIKNPQGKFLLAQRKADDFPPLKWEFPGGKIDQDETIEQALSREIQEEFSLNTHHIQPLAMMDYHYQEKDLQIRFFLALAELSSPESDLILHDHQQYAWVDADQIGNYDLAPADHEMLRLLKGGNYL